MCPCPLNLELEAREQLHRLFFRTYRYPFSRSFPSPKRMVFPANPKQIQRLTRHGLPYARVLCSSTWPQESTPGSLYFRGVDPQSLHYSACRPSVSPFCEAGQNLSKSRGSRGMGCRLRASSVLEHIATRVYPQSLHFSGRRPPACLFLGSSTAHGDPSMLESSCFCVVPCHPLRHPPCFCVVPCHPLF